MDQRRQEELYAEVAQFHAATMRRIARGYEPDFDRRRDLLQEMHLDLWRSLASFDGRCSLRTWVYRIAHNVGVSHVARTIRASSRLVSIEALDSEPVARDYSGEQSAAAGLLNLIYRLAPLDRQAILLYLEGETAAAIAEITGFSPGNVATKIHRIKKLLGQQFSEGAVHAKP